MWYSYQFRSVMTAVGLACLALAPARGQNVIIDEIYYHPPGTNLLEQWFELCNTGAVAADLSGWRAKGDIDFAFPTNTVLAPGAYLVVASDRATFTRLHAGVANFVAGWSGTVHNGLKLEDPAGHTVNAVDFSNDGDWAVRVMGVLQFNHQGWEWSADHDGAGKSLELVNSALPNTFAHNWTNSAPAGGTPGRANSAARANTAPFITEVAHRPVIPRSTDPVTVSVRLTDEHTNGLSATLFWRVDGASSFTTATMFDDGKHGDGLALDGIFAAILPAQANGAVVEFYLQARDLDGNLRTYPAYVPPNGSARTANLLYQVDNSTYTGAQPIYRIIMRENERLELYNLGRAFPDADSDATMNATWITTDGVMTDGATTQCRYNCGVRNRGHGTRTSNPNNYHVNIPGDRPWKGQSGINLNSQYAYSQVLGSAVFRELETPMADSRLVQVRVNSTNLMATIGGNSYGSYAANEQYNNDFVKRSWPLDPRGNSYRGIRQPSMEVTSIEAALAWHGAAFSGVLDYTNCYFKQNNFLESDFSDLIRLMGVLNLVAGYSSSATYVADVKRVLDVEEWMRYMAINTLLDNNETCIANGIGDDYALYRGTNDTRFQVLSYDMDTVMGRGLTATIPRHSLWRMTNVTVMDRFVKTPEFAPVYYRQLRDLATGFFAPAHMNPFLDQVVGNDVPQGTLDMFKAFNSNQVAYVLAQIPLSLTVTSTLPVQSGYPRCTTATTTLSGGANAIDTASVLVNGVAATYAAWLGTWTNASVTLKPGINRVLVQALGPTGAEVGRTAIDIWYDDSSVTSVSGAIAANTTWTAAGGPYQVTASLTINSGVTLTIEAGTTVYLGSGVNLVVANGGTLLAQGTSNAPIRFTTAPGSGVSWGGLTINGAVGSPETRIAYVHFEGNSTTCIEVAGGTIYLGHATFGTTTHQYVALDGASFTLVGCHFPSSTAAFELLHGTGGIKSGGHGIVRDCFFGTTTGYNDIMDFTGGNRNSGQPIIQYYNNVFIGASDDILDLDGTDAWIEGNIFLHSHKNGSPDSSSAISGGLTGSDRSEITIIDNIIYDCDQAANGKEGNFYTLLNNTIVHTTKEGGTDTSSFVVLVADAGTAEGAGMYLEGNIIYDAEKLLGGRTNAVVTFTNNLITRLQGAPWTGPGANNSTADPLLTYVPQLSETYFTNWDQAQIMRKWFSVQSGSPAIGTGPNWRDQGGIISRGVSISGEPRGTNNQTTARLVVGINRTGSGIPTAGFPGGSGFTAYKWRLDAGAWSAETPIATVITLSGLADGQHHVEVVGKNDAGYYQNDALLGNDALVTTSRIWTVDTSYVPPVKPAVRLNEVLAKNSTTLTNLGTTPDLIELYNFGSASVDLSGMGLTDSQSAPYKFVFPPGTVLGPGAFLVVCADTGTGGAYLHTGFSLKQSGDDVSLFDKATNGGALLDSVPFGVQMADYSIGPRTDGTWGLCQPSFGAANVALPTGDIFALRINEWLADAQFVDHNDFVELYNSDPLPVALGGLFLSDASGAPDKSPIPALSFIAGKGLAAFIADSQPGQGSDHLDFKLSPEVGLILLSAPDLTLIDGVTYGPQRTDVSEGRSPNGADTLTDFAQPTPGGSNPGVSAGGVTVSTVTVPLLPMTASWSFNQTANLDGINWQATDYNDSAWPSGPALLAVEDCNCLPAPGIHTTLTLGRLTYYFRTRFVVNTNLAGFSLNIATVLDDGAVISLNGTRILTNGISTGTPAYSTVASRNVSDAGTEFFTVPSTALVQGTNVLAVEVHQVNSTSSDITWGMSLDASRTVTNYAAGAMVPVVLNEVLANNQSLTNFNGTTADYLELFNPSPNTIDLTGMSLTDDSQFGRKWVFPAGWTIRPGTYRVVFCDGTQAVSATNTGFGLNAAGGAVFFFNTDAVGGALIDALNYGLQTPDFSVGRIPNGTGDWTLTVPSAGSPNVAAGVASVSALRINEWMAEPASGSDWFELYNSASQPVALGGLFLTDNLAVPTQSPIPPLSFIGAGANGFQKWTAAGNPEAGADHVNFSLKKGGEALGVFSPSGTMLDGITFGGQVAGVSQGRFPDGSTNIVDFAGTASPAESNYLPLTNALVNEVLTHTDPPLEDAIELLNPTATAVNVGGWYLSNSKDDLKKYRIPDGAVLAAGGFAVFYEAQFNSAGGVPFTFNSAHGDAAILSQADPAGNLTGYRSEITFGAAENGVSFGRYQTSTGVDFTALATRTFGVDNPTTVQQFRTGAGLDNADPKVGPVVVSEIMYRSLTNSVENPNEEFIELQNVTTAAIPLFDPVYPTNTWRLRDAVDFEFPANVTLGAGTRLLVVGFDPTDTVLLAAFCARFSVPPNITILGPWNGRLDNGDDSVELAKPDAVQLAPHPDVGFVPQVLVDKVHYRSLTPWPVDASNGSNSLHRLSASAYGNDPINWLAAPPTAGRTDDGTLVDSDGEGLPDAWELAYFQTLARDGSGDYDGDGFTDKEEHLAGTSPSDPTDYLRVTSITQGNSVTIRFVAVAGKSYTCQWSDSPGGGPWRKLADVPPQPSTSPVSVTDTTANASRFYRLVTPAQP